MQRNPNSDAKLGQELDTKIYDATQKINMLNGAIKQFSGLVVGRPSIDEEQENYAKGIIILKLIKHRNEKDWKAQD
jgi:hypothetical protein